VISIVGVAMSWQAWQRSRDEKPGSANHLAQLGKGRTRFLALTALVSSASFTAGLLFHVVQMWLAPLCGA